MSLYPVAGQSAGFPVSTDSWGARQDTSELAQEILDQVGDPAPPITIGGLTIDASGNVIVSSSKAFYITDYSIYYAPGFGLNINASEVDGSVIKANVFRGLGGLSAIIQGTNTTVQFENYDGARLRFWMDGVASYSVPTVKPFVIDHPTDRDRLLVHACLEGPEAAVFYRGLIRLDGVGKGHVELPDYFAELVDETTATVQVTPVLDGPDDPFGPVAATKVEDGRFVVRGWPAQNVAWRVEATRADAPAVEVEPLKREVRVHGTGPYRWVD